jgi:phage tail sheath protein FI
MKFTTVMQGGFNGLNILDVSESKMDDKATSFSGCALDGYTSPGLNSSPGKEGENNAVISYLTAARIMTDRTAVRHNLLAVPGIREQYITDYISDRVKNNYGLCLYVMDILNYDSSNVIIFDSEKTKPDVGNVISNFGARAIDNNFIATYFPDIYIDAKISSTEVDLTRRIKLPSSVAAFAAMSYSDSQSQPWYAPAGFNRGGLNDIVKNTTSRLSTDDRNSLYDSRINPIARFPQEGYVIFGQKTLQMKKSSLDRVNVRRLLLELRRIVIEISNGLLFEQNTQQLRTQFINQVSSQLSVVRSLEGIESYRVIMDDSNNTPEDVQNNRLNGRILIVPTRAIEYIAIDFIITNSSVQFV